MTDEIQIFPFTECMEPRVPCDALLGLVEHNPEVRQVEHREETEHQVHKDHPGGSFTVLNKNINLPISRAEALKNRMQ